MLLSLYFLCFLPSALAEHYDNIMRPAHLALLAYVAGASVPISQPRQLVQHSSLPCPANDSMVPIYGSNGTVTIKGTNSTPHVIILDYGANVEGIPTFQVISATGDTSCLEITYSESREVLDSYYMVCTSLKLLSASTDFILRATDLLL